MVQREQVKTVLFAAISASLNTPAEDLDEGMELMADLGAKSVNLVRIISTLEDEFGAEIPFMKFRRYKTLGEAIDFVLRQVEA